MNAASTMLTRETSTKQQHAEANGQQVGLLTLDNLAEFFMVQSALRRIKSTKSAFSWPAILRDVPKTSAGPKTTKFRVT